MLSWHSLGESSRPAGVEWLTAGEAGRAATMRFTKRRSEWLLSRWTAKQAIARRLSLAHDPASLARIEIRTILVGEARGAPEVFIDGDFYEIGISQSDRAGWAVCTVGAAGEIGCDLELVEPRSQLFVKDFLTPAEQALVADPPVDASGDAVANLVWSAKESALKVLRTGLRRDTRSVEVSLPTEPALEGWRALRISTEEGRNFSGWWQRYGDFLFTVVTGSPVDPPRPLVSPPGLATASPSHAWLAAPAVDDG